MWGAAEDEQSENLLDQAGATAQQPQHAGAVVLAGGAEQKANAALDLVILLGDQPVHFDLSGARGGCFNQTCKKRTGTWCRVDEHKTSTDRLISRSHG